MNNPKSKLPPTDSSSASGDADITDDRSWTSGDFEIITSDRVRFRVDTHLLLGASNVLRNAAALSTSENKIEFVAEVENANVLLGFLRIISAGRIVLSKDLDGLYDTAIFLQKWDCPAALSRLVLAVQVGVLRRSIWGVYGFFFAAALRDLETAEIALGVRKQCWDEDSPTGVDFGRDSLDMRTWSLRMVQQWQGLGNPEYGWALSHAMEDTGGDRLKLPSKFVEYIAAAEAS